MALIGALDPFTSTDAGDWATYLARVDQFYKANKIEDARKKSVFLTVIGDTTFKLLETLSAPSSVADKTLLELQRLLTDHFTPKRLVIAERYRFWSRNQLASEPYHDYVAELRKLARSCEFADGLDDALRDKFVCGIRDAAVCKKLLTVDGLTLAVALKTASAQELVDREAAHLAGAGEGIHAIRRNHVKPLPHKGTVSVGPPLKPCIRCGGKGHSPADCYHKSSECAYCHKQGHLRKVCLKRAADSHSKGDVGSGSRTTSGAYFIAKAKPNTPGVEDPTATEPRCQDPSPNTDDKAVPSINAVGESPAQWNVNLNINGTPVSMVIDTGAAVTLMSHTTWQEQFNQVLQPAYTRLSTYTGEDLEVLGKATVNVVYQQQSVSLPLLIVEGAGPTLLGRNWLSKIKLDWPSICHVKSPDLILDDILKENEDLFSGRLGKCSELTASLELKPDAKPVFRRPYTPPYTCKEAIEKELDKLHQQGVIEPVTHSDWATPVCVAPKPDGSIRLCGDYSQTVNPRIKVDQYPLPKPQDIFSTLNGGKFFAKLDLSQAYLQVPLDAEGQEITTITTHKGLFRMLRMPYGIASAPAVFQALMDKLLAGLEGVSVYLDDILIAAQTRQQLLERLAQVLTILRAAGLQLKRSKCIFCAESVEYLGYRVDAAGVHATEDKVQAIKQAPCPTSRTELRSFMGLVNFYGRFVKGLAHMAQPLYDLMKNTQEWHWGDAEQKAFDQLKDALSQAPVLVHYDPDLPLCLACDASGTGVGAVLAHIYPDGTERPVAFTSRTLQSSEGNYSQLDREALGIIFGVTKFHQYLYGRQFKLITDNRPLAVILGPKRGIPPIAAMRLQRWAIILAAYTFEVVVKSTTENANADCMSRLPVPGTAADVATVGVSEVPEILSVQLESLPVLTADIAAETAKDAVLSKVLRYVQEGWPASVPSEYQRFQRIAIELTVEQGCLQRGPRTIIPQNLRKRLLEELHIAHSGMVRMKALARAHIWWPGIDTEIEDMVRRCSACQLHRNHNAPVQVTCWPWPSTPWTRIHADFAGPIDGRMFLIVTDAHSKWLEVVAMTSTTSKATIAEFQRLFAQFGLPSALVTNNGPQFTSEEWATFMSQHGIVHMRSSANSALQKSLEVGNSVHARVYNKPVKWLPGTVVRSVGAKSFEVKLASGVLVRRHLNQLRLRAPAPLLPELEKTVADQQARTPSNRVRRRPSRFDE